MARFILSFLLIFLWGFTAHAEERIVRTIDYGGIKRHYIAHIPAGTKESGKALPVVMAFHPALSTAERMEKMTGLHTQNYSENFIIVYPDGFRHSWNAGTCCGSAKRRNVDDTGFVSAIMADLGKRFKLEDKLYLTGHSNGALMTYYLACRYAGSVAAAAPFGAVFPLNDKTCPLDAPVPLLHIHGQMDRQAPIGGGVTKSLGGETIRHENAATAVAFVAAKNECGKRENEDVSLLKTTCTRYSACRNDAAAIFCPVPGLGHTWPGTDRDVSLGIVDFGPARTDTNGSQQIMDFFFSVRQQRQNKE